ncbi:hypothetical protein [uncultured Methanomethylovorans sp.]|uniref:hypothetical protein n=1 Tax=uncultured Methanomethylovorans sp. TaxID=183759 RepID=UPI002AA94BCA|nr:hypothetical protein [uncultured Methanomethylovorans sp.]
MGQKLALYFDAAKTKGGLKAQTKLAMITKMSLTAAIAAPDSPENIALFEKAISML